MKKTIATILLALVIPQLLLAHEGHGFTESHRVLHYIIEPYHALVFLTAVAGFAGLVYRFFRKQPCKS